VGATPVAVHVDWSQEPLPAYRFVSGSGGILAEGALAGRAAEIHLQKEPDQQQRLLGLVENLEVAVEHRTTIGVALGIVMERLSVDQDQAFSYLKRVSQDSNTKVYDLAGTIAETRELPTLHEDEDTG